MELPTRSVGGLADELATGESVLSPLSALVGLVELGSLLVGEDVDDRVGQRDPGPLFELADDLTELPEEHGVQHQTLVDVPADLVEVRTGHGCSRLLLTGEESADGLAVDRVAQFEHRLP